MIQPAESKLNSVYYRMLPREVFPAAKRFVLEEHGLALTNFGTLAPEERGIFQCEYRASVLCSQDAPSTDLPWLNCDCRIGACFSFSSVAETKPGPKGIWGRERFIGWYFQVTFHYEAKSRQELKAETWILKPWKNTTSWTTLIYSPTRVSFFPILGLRA